MEITQLVVIKESVPTKSGFEIKRRVCRVTDIAWGIGDQASYFLESSFWLPEEFCFDPTREEIHAYKLGKNNI